MQYEIYIPGTESNSHKLQEVGSKIRALPPTNVLYDNGPLITNQGAGAGGADVSALQLTNNILGYSSLNPFFRLADDFTVTGNGWVIDFITFFAYQTNSTTTTTITDLNLRIWNGSPQIPGSQIIFGDDTTNRLSATTWSSIYRTTSTTLTNSQRPIMYVEATVNTFLPPGTYWVDYQLTGDPNLIGPFTPPVTIVGQLGKPGANSIQLVNSVWLNLVDQDTPQDIPFIVSGRAAPLPCVHSDTMVSTSTNSSTRIADLKSGDTVLDYKGRAVKIVYNIEMTVKTDEFVSLPKSCLSEGKPNRELLIRAGHPVIHDDVEINPIKYAKRLGKQGIIKKVRTGKEVNVWSLCTKRKTFVMMQGVPVATWGKRDWQKRYKADKGLTWNSQ